MTNKVFPKTKTFYIHPDVIRASITSLLLHSEKLSKKSIVDNVNNRLMFIVQKGNFEDNLFSVSDYEKYLDTDKYFADDNEEYHQHLKEVEERKQQLETVQNKWLTKLGYTTK